jgi:hypothetical protein
LNHVHQRQKLNLNLKSCPPEEKTKFNAADWFLEMNQSLI